MSATEIFDESDSLAGKLQKVIDLPLFDSSSRISTSDVACSLSLEHWHSARALLRASLLPSALVVHRAQFEALTRSIWLTYVASSEQISKLTADLSIESEQAAKNMPQIAQMMQALEKSGPQHAYDALIRFKDNSWKALNSYAHAGIHPIRRHHEGYPLRLLHDVLRNTNGLAVMSCMQAVVLSGQQPLQRTILDIAGRHPACMPPPI
ncbi:MULTISPECIES: hypothetical protein [unclassified Methylophaga]|jgi:hypothetical protein|uniref:DUF6988 family protein n=1 Tax=unclassified Methylophaga TaxID=2629249 RepID=UPI00259CB6EB|nr:MULTISPECIES: hypothetical protein [unclassified Methylophaga]|tara:strand:+ start:1909 stop:2532 length:624 start_codon:yes stop_codon:yes gene_type:complete